MTEENIRHWFREKGENMVDLLVWKKKCFELNLKRVKRGFLLERKGRVIPCSGAEDGKGMGTNSGKSGRRNLEAETREYQLTAEQRVLENTEHKVLLVCTTHYYTYYTMYGFSYWLCLFLLIKSKSNKTITMSFFIITQKCHLATPKAGIALLLDI